MHMYVLWTDRVALGYNTTIASMQLLCSSTPYTDPSISHLTCCILQPPDSLCFSVPALVLLRSHVHSRPPIASSLRALCNTAL